VRLETLNKIIIIIVVTLTLRCRRDLPRLARQLPELFRTFWTLLRWG